MSAIALARLQHSGISQGAMAPHCSTRQCGPAAAATGCSEGLSAFMLIAKSSTQGQLLRMPS